MLSLPSLPATLNVAICIFLAREFVEGYRRWKSNARKLEAIKHLAAAECERNNFVIKSLTQLIQEAEKARAAGDGMAIERNPANEVIIRFVGDKRHKGEKGPWIGASPIRPPHQTILKKYLFDAASLDSGMFYLIERASNAISEVEHIRASFITYIETDRPHLEGFNGYAIRELSKSTEAVEALYFRCTLSPLRQSRVR